MRSLLCEFTRELGVSYSGIIRAKAQIVKERIEDDANEKAALISSVTAISFASISVFPG